MTEEQKKKEMQAQLIRHFMVGNNDMVGAKRRLKRLANDCKNLGIPIGDSIDAIENHPMAFSAIIMFSDMGVLEKIYEHVNILKGNE